MSAKVTVNISDKATAEERKAIEEMAAAFGEAVNVPKKEDKEEEESAFKLPYPYRTYSDALAQACEEGDLETVKEWLERKNSVWSVATTSSDEKGRKSLLHHAAMKGQIEVMQYLIERGADIDALDSNNASPADDAAEAGQEKALKLLQDMGAVGALGLVPKSAFQRIAPRIAGVVIPLLVLGAFYWWWTTPTPDSTSSR